MLHLLFLFFIILKQLVTACTFQYFCLCLDELKVCCKVFANKVHCFTLKRGTN